MRIDSYRQRGFDCLCGNVRMAARALTAVYDGFLEPTGMNTSQLSVLWCVVAVEPVAMGGVAAHLVMDKTTVSRNVARLLELEYVRLRAGPDARVKLVSTTAAGRKAFARAIPKWKAAQKFAASRMGTSAFSEAVSRSKRIARAVARA
jgi:DNA-binding MarR family transcriptional regulator